MCSSAQVSRVQVPFLTFYRLQFTSLWMYAFFLLLYVSFYTRPRHGGDKDGCQESLQVDLPSFLTASFIILASQLSEKENSESKEKKKKRRITAAFNRSEVRGARPRRQQTRKDCTGTTNRPASEQARRADADRIDRIDATAGRAQV